jgi:hypothetical protein
MHPLDHNTLYIGKDQIYKSTNAGATWSQLGSITGVSGTKWTIAIAPTKPQIIYAANGTRLYKSINAGTSWSPITTAPSGSINSIAIDPANEQRLWLAYSYVSGSSNYIYTSVNGGTSFTNFSGTVPRNVAINSIVYENGTNDGLYIGTDIGVFYRNGSMTDWEYYNDGLPNIVVNELQISYTNRKLWAATYGRGLWSADLYNVLPLSLLDFTAQKSGKTALLKWNTSNEINVSRFTIERSGNGNVWNVVGSVEAKSPAAAAGTYSFSDNAPLKSMNYYRLKMVDKDGQYKHSPVRVVSFKEGIGITIVPNPSRDYANIIFNTEVSEAVISVFDAEGRKVFTNNFTGGGNSVYRLNTSKYVAGVYVAEVKANGVRVRERMVVQQ